MAMRREVREALDRLLEVAYRDTGQGRRVADFLLSWWNAGACGKFDPTDLWGLDMPLRVDVLRIVAFIAVEQRYPDTLGYGPQFERLVAEWRPHLVASTVQ